MFGMEKPPHELPRFSIDKLIMKEVAYHISTVLSTRIHNRNKEPWPTLPLRTELYEIRTLIDVDVEISDLENFGFATKSFNPYDPHCICKNHCVKFCYTWIHGACHWPEEDPWRYFYNSSRLNELVNMDVEWKETLQEMHHKKKHQ